MDYIVREEPLGYELKNLATDAPLQVPNLIMIDPCGCCNFRCCFCPCNNSDINIHERHTVMSYTDFCSIVDGLNQFKKKIPVIDLYGFGEPLLNEDLPQMIKYLRNKDVCDLIRTTSNGALLTECLCDKLINAGLDYLKISVEGLDSLAYKETCGVEFDVDKLVYCLKYIRNKNSRLKTGVKIISSAFKNFDDRKRFFEMFDGFVDYIYIRNVQRNWAEFDDMIIPQGSGDGVYVKNKVPGFKICTFPLTHMVVHSNGEIGLCCYDWKHKTSYAHVAKMTLYEAWNSQELRQIRITHLKGEKNSLPYCANCIRKGYDNVDDCSEDIINRL